MTKSSFFTLISILVLIIGSANINPKYIYYVAGTSLALFAIAMHIFIKVELPKLDIDSTESKRKKCIENWLINIKAVSYTHNGDTGALHNLENEVVATFRVENVNSPIKLTSADSIFDQDMMQTITLEDLSAKLKKLSNS